MKKLYWQKQAGCQVWHAYSNKLIVGSIGKREVAMELENFGEWWWLIGSFDPGYGRKANGYVQARRSAIRAVEHAWLNFLERAGLLND